MFYESVKKAYEVGKVRVRLSALTQGYCMTIEAKGFTSMMAACLTDEEREQLAALSHCSLNESHRMALRYLQIKRPEFVSAEEVGREIGDKLGMEGWGCAFGLPLCNKLVSVGLAVQNDAGFYSATTN